MEEIDLHIKHEENDELPKLVNSVSKDILGAKGLEFINFKALNPLKG